MPLMQATRGRRWRYYVVYGSPMQMVERSERLVTANDVLAPRQSPSGAASVILEPAP